MTTGSESMRRSPDRGQTTAAGSPGTLKTNLVVNGQDHRVEHPPDALLLDVVRSNLGLKGTKGACARGECGACTVLIDGSARLACITLVATIGGATIETIEGVAEMTRELRESFADEGAFQCGFCTPGQVVAAEAMLRAGVDPTDETAVRRWMSGNVCRCTGYAGLVRAVIGEAARRDVG